MEMNRVYKFNQDKKELRKARSRVSDWKLESQFIKMGSSLTRGPQ